MAEIKTKPTVDPGHLEDRLGEETAVLGAVIDGAVACLNEHKCEDTGLALVVQYNRLKTIIKTE